MLAYGRLLRRPGLKPRFGCLRDKMVPARAAMVDCGEPSFRPRRPNSLASNEGFSLIFQLPLCLHTMPAESQVLDHSGVRLHLIFKWRDRLPPHVRVACAPPARTGAEMTSPGR